MPILIYRENLRGFGTVVFESKLDGGLLNVNTDDLGEAVHTKVILWRFQIIYWYFKTTLIISLIFFSYIFRLCFVVTTEFISDLEFDGIGLLIFLVGGPMLGRDGWNAHYGFAADLLGLSVSIPKPLVDLF